MYRFIDRPIAGLAPGEQMLVWSMRAWVGAMTAQRCPCATLGPAFARWRVPELLPDFNMTMFVLNGDGLRQMRFGAGCAQVHDDEAMLLVLFHAAAGGDDRRVRRLAAQLVNGEALSAFIVAARQSADVLRRVATPRTPD
jgi:hypothetical protein